jgi:hypothetical protein
MLVRAHDGGLNDHVFVVMFTRQQLENTLENSILRPSTEALMHDLQSPKRSGRSRQGMPARYL